MTSGLPRGFGRLTPRHVVWFAALAALLAFLPSLADGFVFDDDSLIVRNPYAHEAHYVGRCFTTDLWDTPERPDASSSTKFYRPLVCASYIANWNLGGGSALAFHLVNVLLHAGVCMLAARLALRWTGSSIAGLLAALVFAVHPSRSENVVWISGRTDLLMALFLLAAHELAVHAAARRRAWLPWISSFALWGAAILSKEFAVCWSLLLVVEAALFTERGAEPERRRVTIAAGVSLGFALLYLVVRARTFPIRPKDVESMALPWPLNVGYVLLSLGYYVERLVVPWPQTFHFRPVPIVNGQPILFLPSVILGGLALVALVVWFGRALFRDRSLAAMIGVTVVLLLPIINVSYTGFPGTTADRFLYLPLLPLAIAASRTLAPTLTRWAHRPLSPLVLAASTLVYSAVSWVRSLDYLSNETVWRHELEVNPQNPQALAGLGQVLATDGDIEGAFDLLRRAMAPEAVQYHLLASPTRCYLGMLELDGPRIADGNTTALEALLHQVTALAEGRLPVTGGRAGDLDLAMPPDEHAEVHVANASSHLAASGALVASRLGEDEAMRALVPLADRDVALDASTRYNLALALGRAGDYEQANAELARAVARDPSPDVEAATSGLANGLMRVERLRSDAASAPEPTAASLRAHAFLELGAYLRAARQLRPAYLAHPENAELRALYFETLISSRLDKEAAAVAQGMPGKTPSARIAEAQKNLSQRTVAAIAPAPNEIWWID